jgi:hypothetical protein
MLDKESAGYTATITRAVKTDLRWDADCIVTDKKFLELIKKRKREIHAKW